jgi:sugar phosphate isomerase/epimerase
VTSELKSLKVSELIMWEGCVRRHAYVDQLSATVSAGFTGLGLTPTAFLAAADQVGGLRKVRRLAEDCAVALHLDTVTDWAPVRIPRGADAALVERFDHSTGDCLRLVEELGLRSVLAVAVFEIGEVPLDRLVEGFAELCDRCADMAVPVLLEFMPFWGVPDLNSAWAIVQATGRSNAGIMLDTWHFAHSGRDMELLSAIDSTVPIHLQLADGTMAGAGTDLLQATLHTRRAPGDGELGVRDIADLVAQRGLAVSAGPEVFSDELDELTPGEIAAVLGPATRSVLRQN